jgi:hypothetical protein
MIEDKFGDLDVFDEIYTASYWAGGGSGGGSSPESTYRYRKYLERFIRTHKIKSIVDLGCGDWQFSQLIDFGGATYEGFDVSRTVIERNNKLYSSTNIAFHDFTSYENLPSTDLLICKDVLQHLSNEEAKKIISLFPRYRFALVTNDVINMSRLGEIIWKARKFGFGFKSLSMPLVNSDIRIGDYRPLNPTHQPFSINARKVLQWKAGRFGFWQTLAPRNFIYGVVSETTKRTYLVKNSG